MGQAVQGILVRSHQDIVDFCRDNHTYPDEFNEKIIIAEGTTDCTELLKDCKMYNQPIAIPAGVKDCTNMLDGCGSFNSVIYIQDSSLLKAVRGLEKYSSDEFNILRVWDKEVLSSAEFISQINNDEGLKDIKFKLKVRDGAELRQFCTEHEIDRTIFNIPIEIESGVTDCSELLMYFSGFNQPLTIPEGVENCDDMLNGCSQFNQPLTIPHSATSCVSMLDGCSYFNQPLFILNGTKDCNGMLKNCREFNQPITISDSVESCNNMLSRCRKFNQRIVMSKGLKTCNSMLSECRDFNQPIEISEGVESCDSMLSNCLKFNKPIVIPESAKSCEGLLYSCERFNQPLTVPSGVERYSQILRGCAEFNSPLTILSTATGCKSALSGTPSFKSTITVTSMNAISNFDAHAEFIVVDGIAEDEEGFQEFLVRAERDRELTAKRNSRESTGGSLKDEIMKNVEQNKPWFQESEIAREIACKSESGNGMTRGTESGAERTQEAASNSLEKDSNPGFTYEFSSKE